MEVSCQISGRGGWIWAGREWPGALPRGLEVLWGLCFRERAGGPFVWRTLGIPLIKCNILEVFFVEKDCIGDELVLTSGELGAY